MSDERAAFSSGGTENMSFLDKIIRFCLENKLVVVLATLAILVAGVLMAPFDWELGGLPRSPVPVDAIPDIGENQQIVFTEWMGRSPQDVEDQITYPLTNSLLGIPRIKTVRAISMFGFSTIYIIFNDNVDFYWSRSRVLEKLSSLPAGTLPEGVQPALGPDATALGQVFWYTLEGLDEDGNPTGGWDLHELRSIQDWDVRYRLLSAGGISEVASVGGFVKEYQVDVDPDAMRAYRVTLDEVFNAVQMSNVDVGARTIEVNKVEYVIRGLGFIESVADVENSVIKVNDNVPIYIRNVAKVTLGPGLRRGALDKGGAEAVGGVVVVRYGENPLAAIQNVKDKIAMIAPGLPARAVIDFERVSRGDVERFAEDRGFEAFTSTRVNQDAWLKWLQSTPREERPDWVKLSRVTIVPFYDRTGLIHETLGTLNKALVEEILVTIIVVIVMLIHLRSSILVGGLLPLAVLMCFIAMKLCRVDANIVALSGIAIAIGTMVDMGIIVCENILKRLDEAGPDEKNTLEVVFRAASEVGGAVLTAIATTVVSFLPVFMMTGAEGKLFKPLAFTKTFALLASVIIALTIIPALAHVLFTWELPRRRLKNMLMGFLVVVGIVSLVAGWRMIGIILAAFGLYYLFAGRLPEKVRRFGPWTASIVAVLWVAVLLTNHWQPVGPAAGFVRNFIVVIAPIGGLLGLFRLFERLYGPILRWCLAHKLLFLSIPAVLVLMGGTVWMGFDRIFGWVPRPIRVSRPVSYVAHKFPGLGKEFMPPLDEGSFLFMPSTMPHASIGEALDVLQKTDMAFSAIPEIESVVGKIGRADTPLDPAPVSMLETVINYKSEYITNKQGHRVNFQYDRQRREFARDENGELIPDPRGRPYRQWRDHIRSPDDIWNEIDKAGQILGTTRAPQLQPIETRRIMLQTGMRARMGVKIQGPNLDIIEQVGLQIERLLKEVPSVEPSVVVAERVVGKPYFEIDIDRDAIARYGIKIRQIQDVIEVAIGGRTITTTVEGRERYPVRVRYLRELRDQIETLRRVLVAAPDGTQIPLEQLIETGEIRYVRGKQVIKSENATPIAYVTFDMKPGHAEVDVVEDCQRYLQAKLDSGELVLPAGVSYTFTGTYENQVRSQKTLSIVLPFALFIIFLILYLQFRSVPTSLLVFSGIIVAWAGGFILIWLYAQPWFMNFSLFGTSMRDLFQVHTIHMSVAIWVGFLALFGIASDDGVVMATYLRQSFASRQTKTVEDVREAVLAAGLRRIRPCLMTTATTILALTPVLTSTGRGSDIMVPMAIPSFGGMLIELVTLFVVPVLYCVIEEFRLKVRPEPGNVSDGE